MRTSTLAPSSTFRSSPSAGLLDAPQDACYYDWVLIDPKDSPFAIFRFHYRSWYNLCQLNLVPTPDSLHVPSLTTPLSQRRKSIRGTCHLKPGFYGDDQPPTNISDGESQGKMKISPASAARPLPEVPAQGPTTSNQSIHYHHL